MQSGLTFELVGMLDSVVDFQNPEGDRIRGVNVAWMGGTIFFSCKDLEDLSRYGHVGDPIRINGILSISKKGAAKLRAGEVTVIKKQKNLTG